MGRRRKPRSPTCLILSRTLALSLALAWAGVAQAAVLTIAQPADIRSINPA